MASNKVASIVAQDTARLPVYRLSTVHSVGHVLWWTPCLQQTPEAPGEVRIQGNRPQS
jgi:hypothetical protein